MMSLGCIFDDLPHPVDPLGGGTQAKLSPGVETMGAGTQSGPQLVVSGVSGIAAEGTAGGERLGVLFWCAIRN